MRAFDSDFKRYLHFGKLANSLTPEEESDFDQLMDTDAEFKQEFLVLTQKLTPEKLAYLSVYKNPDHWKNVTDQLKKRSYLDIPGQYKIGVASLIIVAVISLSWLLLKKDCKMEEVVATGSVERGVNLQLASGKSIDLTKFKGEINVDAAIIKNDGKSMSYSINDKNTDGMNSLIVSPGMDYHIVLPDGTGVWLNSTTKMNFPFSFNGNTREIFIDGEAYLDVAQNVKQPFIVHLPGSSVEVLGTGFNVNSYESGIVKVSLVSGKVKFKGPGKELSLNPGQEGVDIQGGNLFQQPFDKTRTLSWRQGLLYFDEAPLSEIVKAIPRWYGAKVIIDNSRNDKKRFVGTLDKNQPLNKFLKNLSYVAQIDSYFDKDGVLHFK